MKRLVAAGMPRVYQTGALLPQRRGAGAVPPPRVHDAGVVRRRRETTTTALTRMEHLLATLRAEIAAGGGAGPAACTAPPVRRVTMARLWQDDLHLRSGRHASAAELAALARRLAHPGRRGGHLGATLQPYLSDPHRAAHRHRPSGGGGRLSGGASRPWPPPPATACMRSAGSCIWPASRWPTASRKRPAVRRVGKRAGEPRRGGSAPRAWCRARTWRWRQRSARSPPARAWPWASTGCTRSCSACPPSRRSWHAPTPADLPVSARVSSSLVARHRA